eukprot:2318765-Pleurochrysis_carterae.AAC.1
MQTTNIPIIDHSRAFATLYDEYLEPPPSTRKKSSAATPATPPHAQLSSQTPLLLPPTAAPAAATQAGAPRARATHYADAKRARTVALSLPAARSPQQRKHTATVGESWIVPASLYPQERCNELGGLGWQVTIRRVRPFAVQVSFDNARSESGQHFQRVWHKLADLRSLAD